METLLDKPLGQLINHPDDVIDVFHEFSLPLGARESLTLKQALHQLKDKSLEFLDRLTPLLEQNICLLWQQSPVAVVIDYIKTQFHDAHRAQLLAIIAAANRIELNCAEHPACPHGLSRITTELMQDLTAHMDQEECAIFPHIIAGEEHGMFPELAMMHHSHDRHMNLLEDMLKLTNGLQTPVDAMDDWQSLYERLCEFMLQLHLHVALENKLVFKD